MRVLALPSIRRASGSRPGLRWRRPPVRTLLAFAAALALLMGGWLWLRDSSLVAIDRVTVTGVSGPQAAQVRAALQSAGRDMTTLNVRHAQLATAVRPYPVVQGVEAHADFPHGLRIVVREHVPVAVLVSGGDRVPVAADGTLLRGTPWDSLPVVAAPAPPAGDVLRDHRLARAVAVLAAAPPALRAHVIRVYLGSRGLTAPLRDGPVLYFGRSDRLPAKWAAATAVLADRSSAGATYLDLRLPERPAAGGIEPPHVEPSQTSPEVGAQPAQPQTTVGGP
ncbi:MAG: cell division protein FtsQ [Solirubrobacteraceae bacterium]|jgi:cell division protein FtsQ|nr:cell division protein FtsQ [Solirubrobacteraceae bacterium]MEA2395835.1 cell division protein FtsQ [Solirubrobacteraceae bacterium]